MEKDNDLAVKLFAGGAIVVGLGIGGYYLFIKPAAEQKEEEIKYWLNELDGEIAELATYTLRIQEEGIPEEVYSSAIEAMQAEMAGKIDRLRELTASKTIIDRVIDKIHEFGVEIGSTILFAALAVGGFYLTAVIAKEIFKKRRGPPPGGFSCPIEGAVFATEGQLKDHMRIAHPITIESARIFEAQRAFQAMPSWVQATVASEAGIWDRIYDTWTGLETWEQVLILMAAAVIIAWLISSSPIAIPALLSAA